jgi:hypothetical protein
VLVPFSEGNAHLFHLMKLGSKLDVYQLGEFNQNQMVSKDGISGSKGL